MNFSLFSKILLLTLFYFSSTGNKIYSQPFCCCIECIPMCILNSLGSCPLTCDAFCGSNISQPANDPLCLGTNCAPMPVELAHFNATSIDKGQKIKLVWKTLSEDNNKGFYVERMNDMSLKWELISFIEGSGNSQISRDYSFIDKNPLQGINYYRLKQLDYDGKISYSEIISINLNNAALVTIFPTLAKEWVMLNYNEEPQEIPQIAVYNLVGKRVMHLSNDDSHLNVKELSPGQYIITVSYDGKHFTDRFFKR